VKRLAGVTNRGSRPSSAGGRRQPVEIGACRNWGLSKSRARRRPGQSMPGPDDARASRCQAEPTLQPASAAATPAEFSSFVDSDCLSPTRGWWRLGGPAPAIACGCRRCMRTKGPNFRRLPRATHGCMARLHGPDELMAKADRARASNARLLRHNRPGRRARCPRRARVGPLAATARFASGAAAPVDEASAF
jgi:hypothetical protein